MSRFVSVETPIFSHPSPEALHIIILDGAQQNKDFRGQIVVEVGVVILGTILPIFES